jgi:hypothetical protein
MVSVIDTPPVCFLFRVLSGTDSPAWPGQIHRLGAQRPERVAVLRGVGCNAGPKSPATASGLGFL